MASKASRKPSSNGSKEVSCVRCQTPIAPYAGREVGLSKYAHHPGQCADVAEHATTVRAAATGQGTLFAWRCERTEGHGGMASPEICRESGTDRAAFTAHMRDVHGARAHVPPYRLPAKLRKSSAGRSARDAARAAVQAAALDRTQVRPVGGRRGQSADRRVRAARPVLEQRGHA